MCTRSAVALGALLLPAGVTTASATGVPVGDATTSASTATVTDIPWTGTWATAMENRSDVFADKTLRQIVHTSIGGSAARIQLSNRYGTVPVTVSNVHIAKSVSGSMVDNATDRYVTFSGAHGVTIPVGGTVVSDPAAFDVAADSDVAISFFVPTRTGYTQHGTAQQTNYYADGDQSANASLEGAATYGSYSLLSNLDVQAPDADGALVAFGASITDGLNSGFGTNHRWSNLLSGRLGESGRTVGVLNKGISGNNLLSDGSGSKGLTRFRPDVLDQPGVRWVIISDDPINDLLRTDAPTAEQLIEGLAELAGQAHDAGVKVFCSTLTPFRDTAVGAGWSERVEQDRQAINTYLRGSAGGCDAVVDQDAALRDPADPTRMSAALDSGDHLHPNDSGMQAIADAVPLAALDDAANATIPAGGR
ncbi:GDSL-type esterase/lipase family protein [Streptomyces dioscori]|nr:GDSL-type esterase/lipase family protein [Streptomyces dioscori]